MIPFEPLAKRREQVIKEWVAAYHALVFRTVYYYVKNRAIAEDLTQEVFVKAFQKFDSFREDANPKTWLYRIAINTAKDYLRSWNHRHLLFTSVFYEKSSSQTIEQQVMQQFQNDELVQNVMGLPTKYREVIVLYYFEEMRTPEIAEILALKESTVRVRLSRGLEKLRQLLKGGDQDWTSLTDS
ncbi:sigma-70 family RNA polymerase sigma factor [Brevibacillus borstelensis]|uniref:sigma-70 family RNA polymerase sigma factor n=1 Tax=Brevibacillus borstelensis TaxID=45462 RepID=UPI00203C47BE|nr:sigma-70 family RNA polymerase sigma factor [Brevibacillus borstelensis]MCM3621852.1 sigma-70 family RNA polymerase sigma factor [Brevibacillus borstelensis]